MPERTERDAWWAFINGCPEHEWNIPKRPKKRKRVWNAETERYVRTDDMDQYEVSYTRATVENDGTGDIIKDKGALVYDEYGELVGNVGTNRDEPEKVEVEDNAEAETLLPTPFATPQPEARYKKSSRLRHPTNTLLTEMDSVSHFFAVIHLN